VREDDEAIDLQLKGYTAAGRGEGFELRAAYLHDLTAPKDNARHQVDAGDDAVREAIGVVGALCRGVRSRSVGDLTPRYRAPPLPEGRGGSVGFMPCCELPAWEAPLLTGRGARGSGGEVAPHTSSPHSTRSGPASRLRR